MPETELTVSKHTQRGPCTNILFIFKSQDSDYNKEFTKEIKVDETVKIKFCFRFVTASNGSHVVEMSSKKEIGDYTVKIEVVCKKLSFSKESICSEDWIEWINIGSHSELIPQQTRNNGYGSTQKQQAISLTEVRIVTHKVISIGFDRIYDDTDFTDFTLQGADGSVSVHKACLVAHCEAFRNVLSGPWASVVNNCIKLDDIPVETLKDMKSFIYLGVLPESERLRNLLVLACRYFINILKEECVKKLALTVLPEELNTLHTLCCMYGIPELSAAIAQWTPEEVIDEAYRINKNQINGCLQSRKMCLGSRAKKLKK